MIKKNYRKLNLWEIIFLVACFSYFFLWILKPYNFAPDEGMRYDVSEFFFRYNRLPKYRETQNEIWGFSYALLPTMLCNVLDYIPMKLVSIFTSNETAILYAARTVSVFAGTFTLYFMLKSFKLLFKSEVAITAVIFTAALPQYAFVSSYVNNDILALLGVSIIIYAWALSREDKWNYRNATWLCIGMAICATSYYNSYIWILCSIFFFFITFYMQYGKDGKKLLKMTGFIVGLTFLLGGYLFVRHIVLYGDLLGMKTTHIYSIKYSIPELRYDTRLTPQKAGVSVIGMLRGDFLASSWIKTTLKSFIGCFGFMQYPLSKISYLAYTAIMAVGVTGLLLYVINDILLQKKKISAYKWLFAVLFFVSAAVTVGLTVYNSYTVDYQPQGRYCFPALPVLAAAVGCGIYVLINKLCSNYKKVAYALVYAGMIALSVHSYIFFYLPAGR